jgi:oligoendopeptidase F
MFSPALHPPLQRSFLPASFRVTDWESLEPYYRNLLRRPLESMPQLEAWLRDRSELEAITQEAARWRFIHSTLDTGNPEYRRAFRDFVGQIKPLLVRQEQALDQKFLDCPLVANLDSGVFFPYLRRLRSRRELFCEDNVDLQSRHELLQKRYEEISSRMSVEVDGVELTLNQASVALSDEDRALRERVYLRTANRRLEDKLLIDQLFDELIDIRQRLARNAGFANYRDFQFANLGRFDYSPDDCLEFHESIRLEVMPLMRYLDLRKAVMLDLDTLRPWDIKVGSTGRNPGRPFRDASDLLDKAVEVFYRIDPLFGDCLATMRERRFLDLESRLGKAPGGYNCPMPESGVPFIFMNASGATRDVKTMMHEGGHAVHAFLAHGLPYTGLKQPPSEISELASMAMEFFSYDHWELFYPDADRVRLARIEHLERVIQLFPWVASIDSFQHWVYTRPGHSVAEREQYWLQLQEQFSSPETDWSGLDHYHAALWQTQLHLFKAPFYYVEYAIAQLGAIALWRNYQQDPAATLAAYKQALSLGYTRTIAETYEAAGIRFDFSREYVRELLNFLKEELESLFRGVR